MDINNQGVINKLLTVLALSVVSSVIACVAITFLFINSKSNIVQSDKTLIANDKNVTLPPHPYNECIKLLIDQTNKENKECDFNKVKSVCFELLNKDKQDTK